MTCSISGKVVTGTVTNTNTFTLPSPTESDYLLVMMAYTGSTPSGFYDRLPGIGSGSRDFGGFSFDYANGYHDGDSDTYTFGSDFLSLTWVLVRGGTLWDRRFLTEHDGGTFTSFDTIEFVYDDGPFSVESDKPCNAFAGVYATTDGAGVLTGAHTFAQEVDGSVSLDVDIANPGSGTDATGYWFTGARLVGIESTVAPLRQSQRDDIRQGQRTSRQLTVRQVGYL